MAVPISTSVVVLYMTPVLTLYLYIFKLFIMKLFAKSISDTSVILFTLWG